MSDDPSGRPAPRDPEGGDDATRDVPSVLVLAGGRAARLGGRKAERDVGGVRLLDRVLAVARTLSDDVILLAGERALPAPGVRRVADWPGVGGPLGGLGAGLEAARHAWCVLLPCDLPQASSDVVGALLARRRAGCRAVIVRDASGWQPFHALYSRTLLPDLRSAVADGERSLVRWLARLDGIASVDASELRALDPELNFLEDIDTRDDLERAERRLAVASRSRPAPRQGPAR
ncbi:MAG: molybdenum cofactor guanylyltransferase [Planctomycetes bacterium]|nr:molybdenum cofactor guanylyltransferase [Planctomycetota bacterium]